MSRKWNRPLGLFALVTVAVLVLSACSAAAATSLPPTATPVPAATAATGAQATSPAYPTPAAGATAPGATPQTLTQAGGGQPAAPNPDTLVEATIGDAQSLDPSWAYDTMSGFIIQNVYETLVFPKKDSATDMVPMLATKWDISPDGKTYTFHIRQGVKFQDGQPLTPEDVAYSLWRTMIQDRAGGPSWIILQPFFGLDVQSFKDDVVGKQFNNDWTKAVQAVEQAVTFDNSAGTVTMHLKQPYGPMLQILAGTWGAIMSKPWVIQQGGWNGDPATAQKYHDPAAEKDELFKVMNGTGPYRLQRWAPGQEFDLVRNDNYWVQQPLWPGGPTGPAKTKNVIVKEVNEWGTRFSMLKAGDADIAYVDRQYIAQVDPLVKETCKYQAGCSVTNQNGTLRAFTGLPELVEDVIQMNQDVNTTGGNSALGSGALDGNGVPANFFSDEHVRKGFEYAFDWNTFIKQVWNGEATQGLGPVISGEIGYNANQAHYSFDLTKATEEFKASTLKSPDGKSLWDTGFYVQYLYNSGNDQRRVAGEILKTDLAKINPKFHVAVVEEPWPVFLSSQTAGRLPLYLLGWQEDFHDPQDWVFPFLASGGTYASTQHFDKNLQAQLDKLINQAVTTTDPNQRAQLYGQLQNLAYQNALDIFVEQPQNRHYEQAWVQGYYYNPLYNDQYFYVLSK